MQDAPVCVTVNVLPPIVSVPVRDDGAGPRRTRCRPTVPLPESARARRDRQPVRSLLEAVHEHPPGAVTVTVPDPPEAVKIRDVVSIVTTHGAPACFTVNVLPPTVMVPERRAAAGIRRDGEA